MNVHFECCMASPSSPFTIRQKNIAWEFDSWFYSYECLPNSYALGWPALSASFSHLPLTDAKFSRNSEKKETLLGFIHKHWPYFNPWYKWWSVIFRFMYLFASLSNEHFFCCFCPVFYPLSLPIPNISRSDVLSILFFILIFFFFHSFFAWMFLPK